MEDTQAEVENSLVEPHILEVARPVGIPEEQLGSQELLGHTEASRIEPATGRLAEAGFDRTFNNY